MLNTTILLACTFSNVLLRKDLDMIWTLKSLVLVFFIMLKAASFIFFIISSKFNVKKEPSCRLPGIFMMPRALSFCYNQHILSVIPCILWLFRYQLLIIYLNEYNSESNKIVVNYRIILHFDNYIRTLDCMIYVDSNSIYVQMWTYFEIIAEL